MTNQEPGAPEPLTSEWRHKEGVLCCATVPGFAGPCGYEHGEIIHDVGRTDRDTIVGRVHAFEAGWGSGGCERCREGWPCDAEAMRRRAEAAETDLAALSHPESDTRTGRDPNMDYERRDAILAVVANAYPAHPESDTRTLPPVNTSLMGTVSGKRIAPPKPESDTRPTEAEIREQIKAGTFPLPSIERASKVLLGDDFRSHPESDTRGLDEERLYAAIVAELVELWGEPSDGVSAQVRPIVARNIANRYAASPDLSIDREGHHDTDDCFDQPERHHPQCPKPGGGWCNCGAQQDINREVFARHAALRGTTQPEPTE